MYYSKTFDRIMLAIMAFIAFVAWGWFARAFFATLFGG